MTDVLNFPHNWRAEILQSPPLIIPARHFTYPRQIPGEEDALAQGALHLLIHPANGEAFLATCALGFTNPTMPTGIFPCPTPQHLCAVAGGYAYIIDTAHPEHCTHIPMKPVVEVKPIPTHNLILFAGFHTILAWNTEGIAWQTARLTWEGLRLTDIEGNTLHGFGWNLLTDREAPFTIDLLTGHHHGGAFEAR